MPVVAIIIILVVGTASFVNTILCHKLACHTTGLRHTACLPTGPQVSKDRPLVATGGRIFYKPHNILHRKTTASKP